MSSVLGPLLWMIVVIGVLVSFHEFGHYWVARRCGVKVLRFSVGFGRPLWSRRDRHGTEFAIAAIPLGGYVKMLDEAEGDVPPGEQAQCFNRKPVLQRIAIIAAGPAANLLLCVLLLWAMFVVGRPDYSATLGPTTGIAADAGLRNGDRIQAIDQRNIATWMEALQALTIAAIDGRDARLQVIDANGTAQVRQLPLSRLPAGFNQENVGPAIGLSWQHLLMPALVATTQPGSPADGVLLPQDLITAVDGQPVYQFNDLPPLIQQLGQRGGAAMIEVDRQGERHAFLLQPRRLENPGTGKPVWALGVEPPQSLPPAEYDSLQQFGPLAALPVALRETGKMTADSLGMIRRMLTGHASPKNVSGPITIARVADSSAKRGVAWFLYFMALVSLSLGIVNLLPIPVLDGGRLLYYLIELVKGSPMSDRSVITGQYIGLALLAGLMGLGFYNDILRLVT